jgi:hypothetical protein
MAKVLHASPLFEIWLDGVESLSPEVAALLMRPEPDGQFVTTYRFGGLKTFPPEVARQWAGVHAGLLLPGDVEISVATARELAAFPGSLELGVTSLTPEVARLLAESPGQLTLSGLETLSPDVAQAFSHRQRYGVTMPALRTLEADAVRALCDNSGARLRGMDDPEAPGLRCRSGAWSFPGLETISADAAAALAETDGHQFEFWGLSSLSAEAAQGLAATRGWDGRLPSVISLPARHGAWRNAAARSNCPASKRSTRQRRRRLACTRRTCIWESASFPGTSPASCGGSGGASGSWPWSRSRRRRRPGSADTSATSSFSSG